MRRTRIVCTLGPASLRPPVLRQLISAGMDVARFNFSHGTEAEHRAGVAAVRAAAAAAGRHVALLQDLQGPKIRTGRVEGGLVRLLRGRTVVLTAREVVGGEGLIPVSHPELLASLRPGDRMVLADGQIELRVRSMQDLEASCTVIRGGLLGERKGIAVPGRSFDLPALTEKDHRDLRLGAELRFDYVALSFVRRPADLDLCRSALGALEWNPPLVAKLEKREVLAHLSRILECADAVMVARGDLGVELALGEVPAVQKDIIYRANRAGVPVITATEMLESMITSNRPTRAEASDVANAIWDGTDAVMLSQETSTGAHPVEAVRAMARICLSAERHPSYQRHRPLWAEPGSVASAIAHAAAAVAKEVDARAIIAFTESGSTALRVSKAYPTVRVIAASPHPEILRRTALYSDVVPLLAEPGKDTDEMVLNATTSAVAAGLIRKGDRVVLVAGVAAGTTGQTNLLKVVTVG